MAQEKVLGDQLNILDVASDISNDSTAIGDIAAGIVNEPGAIAALTAGIDHSGLIGVSGSPATYTHTELDSHIDDVTIHFTEASIDHDAILNSGTIPHVQIDTHINDATIHFTEATIDHANIIGTGVNTHAQIDTHLADATIHFVEASIDHANIIGAVGTTYSHASIDNHINDATIHFTEASIVHANIVGVIGTTYSHAQIDGHIDTTALHFTKTSIVHGDLVGVVGTTYAHAAIDSHIDDTTIHFNTLDGLSDVNAPTPNNDDVLVWETSTSTWIPGIRIKDKLFSDLDLNSFSIVTANAPSGSANNIVLQGGNAVDSTAGDVNIYGGADTGAIGGSGGSIVIKSGYSSAGVSGGVSIRTSGGAGSTGTVGDITIVPGSSNADAGNTIITAGSGGNTFRGGDINITGSSTFRLGNDDPGDINLTAGGITTTGVTGRPPGNINIHSGERRAEEAAIRLWKDTDTSHTTGFYVELKTPALLATNHTLTLPVDSGIDRQVLTTDGTGLTSWQTPNVTSVIINNQLIPGVGSPPVYNYTITTSALGSFVVVDQDLANTVSIPPGSTFPIGSRFELTQLGISNTTITVSGGELIRYKDAAGGQTATSVIVSQHQEAKLTKIDATTWFASLSGLAI